MTVTSQCRYRRRFGCRGRCARQGASSASLLRRRPAPAVPHILPASCSSARRRSILSMFPIAEMWPCSGRSHRGARRHHDRCGTALLPFIMSGQVRPLAAASRERRRLLPERALFAELGYVGDWKYRCGLGFVAPAAHAGGRRWGLPRRAESKFWRWPTSARASPSRAPIPAAARPPIRQSGS